ncbi:hydroxymethylbilane synthase [soil metagenome]
MSSIEKVVIGTRGSALALTQADITARALRTVNPSIDIEVRIIQTRGDVNFSPIPLDTIGKGWFTEEIEAALYAGDIDIAVHSLKDMADEMPEGLCIGAYLAREDARDALVTKHGETLEELPHGAVIGTDSARRQVQMLALRPDAQMRSLRGNVNTRLQKLTDESYDAIILAAAGLKRLGLEDRITRYFEPNEMTPSPGQGILAVQMNQGNAALQTLLDLIHDSEATHAARIERSFSKAIGGGCKSPTGAYAYRDGSEYVLIGMQENSEGHIVREELRSSVEDSESLGTQLAQKMVGK